VRRSSAAADGAAGVIFADFGYGLITSGLLDQLMPLLRPRVPVITADVSGMQSSLLRFRAVDLLCPTEREVRQTLNDFASGLTAVVYQLLRITQAKQALITMGKQGLVAFDECRPTQAGEAWERHVRSAYLPSLAHHVIDSLGLRRRAAVRRQSPHWQQGGSVHAGRVPRLARGQHRGGATWKHPDHNRRHRRAAERVDHRGDAGALGVLMMCSTGFQPVRFLEEARVGNPC
jgi:hypothetical protein